MKRMVDNKDYDTLKNNVSELGTKVDNVKDIKTITIEATQLVDETHAQLTDEQFEIIENNSYINVVFPTGQSIGFNRIIDALGNYHLTMCIGDSSEISFFTGDIDSNTKIVTLKFGDFSGGGKQLYQHNVSFVYSYNNDKVRLGFTIISDVSTEFDKNDFATWLTNAGYDGLNKTIMPSGYVYITSLYGVSGFGFISSSQNFIVNYYLGSTSTNQQWALSSTNYTISDNVIAL